MKIILFVGLGGFVGSILRLLISDFIQTKSLSSFPYGTLSVNVIGCFVIGLLFALVEKSTLSVEMRYLLTTGLIGGFTTFSAFSYETFSLLRVGDIRSALVYVMISVLSGLAATCLGWMILNFK